MDRAFRPAALCRDPPRAFRARVRRRHCARTAPRSTPSRATTQPPTSTTRLSRFDRSGRALARIEKVFYNLASSETSPALQAVEREMSPRLAAHYSAIYLDARALRPHRRAASPARRTRTRRRATAPARARAPRFRARRRAACRHRRRRGTRRSSSALPRCRRDSARTCSPTKRATGCVLKDERDLAGLPEDLRAAARAAAQQRGEQDGALITLSRSLIVPFLTFSERRDLREQAFKAWIRRGENDGEHDNRPIAREILALRNELARLHGYATTPTTRWSTGWPARRPRSRNCWRRSGSRRRRAPRQSATRCARPRWRTARRTRSSRGTGASTPKRCARRITASTTRR